MRVCFISFEYPPNILGGAGTYAENIVRGLKNKGVDVIVVTRGNTTDYDQKVFRITTSGALYWRRLFFIRPAMNLFHRLEKIWKFDLVHFNEPHVITEKPNLPSVCTLHSCQANEIKMKLADLTTLRTLVDIRDMWVKSLAGSLFDISTAHATDRIISPSAHLADLIRSYCLVDERRLSVIPNGIDLESFKSEEDCDAEVLREHGLATDGYLLFMGRLSVLKGAQYLIQAFQRIRKDYPNLKLVIAGRGDYESSLRSMANGIGNVVFTGYVSSLSVKNALYRNSLAVVVPSLYEALPMVIMEAMSCKKPIIASRVGDIPSLVKSGENGFLVDPSNSIMMEKYIRILCDDKSLRERMGSFGLELMKNEFSLEKMTDRTLKVYDSLLQSS